LQVFRYKYTKTCNNNKTKTTKISIKLNL